MAAMTDAGIASGEGDSPHVLHSATACRIPAEGIVTHNDPVASYNSGTEIYDDLGIQVLVEGMDLPCLASRYLGNCQKQKRDQRGNFQIGFGLASCVNVGRQAQAMFCERQRGGC